MGRVMCNLASEKPTQTSVTCGLHSLANLDFEDKVKKHEATFTEEFLGNAN